MTVAPRTTEPMVYAMVGQDRDLCELVDYSHVQLQKLLVQVRRATALLAASRGHAELRALGMRQAADLLGQQAESALLAGRDDLAGQALASRAATLGRVSRVRDQQSRLCLVEERISAAATRLESSIETFGIQKEVFKAFYTASRAWA